MPAFAANTNVVLVRTCRTPPSKPVPMHRPLHVNGVCCESCGAVIPRSRAACIFDDGDDTAYVCVDCMYGL